MHTQVSTTPTAREITRPRDRTSPVVRKKMSGAAIKSFFQITEKWGLDTTHKKGLLGWPSHQTLYNWQSGNHGTLSYDTLTRVSLILGIYKALHILYPETAFADNWINMPNTNMIFGGKRPLDLMIDDGIDGLYQVRRLLDSRRGGWN